MTFDELAAEVYVLTNRPDLVAETESAIKSATLKAHQSDFYSKDIHETGIQFDTEDYIQTLDIISLVTNFRSLKYVKRVAGATDREGKLIDVVKVEELLDNYQQPRTDISYVAGRNLEIRASVPFKYLLVGMYVFPITNKANYSSWVAIQYPWVIIYEAVRSVLIMTGQIEEANGYGRLAAEQALMMQAASILDVGY